MPIKRLISGIPIRSLNLVHLFTSSIIRHFFRKQQPAAKYGRLFSYSQSQQPPAGLSKYFWMISTAQ